MAMGKTYTKGKEYNALSPKKEAFPEYFYGRVLPLILARMTESSLHPDVEDMLLECSSR